MSEAISQRMLFSRTYLQPDTAQQIDESLTLIQPEELPPGALCLVQSVHGIYEWRPNSTAVPDSFLVIASAKGTTVSGRWHQVGLVANDGVWDFGGLPIENYYDALSSEPAQTIAADPAKAFIPLWLDQTQTLLALSDLGFSAATATNQPSREVEVQIKWRTDVDGGTRHVDLLKLSIDFREDSGDYYAQVGQVDTPNVSDEGAANSAVELAVTGASSAEYWITVTAAADGQHTLQVAMQQSELDARRVLTRTTRGSVERNFA